MKSLLTSIALALAAPLACQAAVLGTGTMSAGVGFPTLQEHRFRLVLDFANHTEELFEDVYLDSTSTGVTLTADSTSDTDFGPVANTISNGTAELFCLSVMFPPGGGGSCLTEKAMFNLTAPDFYGDDISTITLHVDSLSFVQPNERGGTSLSAKVTIEVLGVQGGAPAAQVTWGGIKARYR